MRLVLIAFFTTTFCPAQQTFDVASVKVADATSRDIVAQGGPGTPNPTRFHYGRAIMLDLLTRALGVDTDQIAGPQWISEYGNPEKYVVDATMSAGTTKEQFQAMLRTLLIDRFHLAFHHETRNFPAYVLVLAKGGSKLTPYQPPPEGPAAAPRSSFDKDGFPVLPAGAHMTGTTFPGMIRQVVRDQTGAEIAASLSMVMRQDMGADTTTPAPRVTDQTGLAGTYDYRLEFACQACRAMVRLPGNQDADKQLPDFFAAIEKQLGLKLVKSKDVPVDVIVIDRIDKVPVAN